MFLTKVEAHNFRNYQDLSVDSFSHINIFLGDNGHGKTSFLEAIYFALKGKSFKPYVGSCFVREGQDQGFVKLDFKEKEGRSQIATSFLRKEDFFKKEVTYCGKKVPFSYLSRKASLFAFTEQSLKAIRQGPSERRHFVDQILLGKGEGATLSQFVKILREKRSLLKNYKKNQISLKELKKTLEVLNESFLKISFQLTNLRIQTLSNMFKNISSTASDFFPNPLPQLEFKYQIQGRKLSQENIQKEIVKDLEEKKEDEIRAGLCFSGPQHHEILFLYNGQDSRVYCSQGQQRILMLVLIGTQLKKSEKGLLFLDDVLMELDEKNQEKFLSFLEKIPCQSFLTNCKKIPLNIKKRSFFFVKNGTIQTQYV